MKRDLGVIDRYSVYTLIATVFATLFSLGYGYISVLVGAAYFARSARAAVHAPAGDVAALFHVDADRGDTVAPDERFHPMLPGCFRDTVASVLFNLTTVLSTLVAMFLFDWASGRCFPWR